MVEIIPHWRLSMKKLLAAAAVLAMTAGASLAAGASSSSNTAISGGNLWGSFGFGGNAWGGTVTASNQTAAGAVGTVQFGFIQVPVADGAGAGSFSTSTVGGSAFSTGGITGISSSGSASGGSTATAGSAN